MTQWDLAQTADIDIRTVQRAEAGEPIWHTTLSRLASAVALQMAEIALDDDIPAFGRSVLRRVISGRQVIEMLEASQLSKLECIVEPTDGNIEDLREIIRHIESLMRDPWSVIDPPPLRFSSLADRLDAIQLLSKRIQALEAKQIAVFSGSAIEAAVMPYRSDGEVYVPAGQKPEMVRALRILVADYTAERVTVPRVIEWPVKVIEGGEEEPDDDVPF